jgi:uncharacterized FlaG/YvyC family protein
VQIHGDYAHLGTLQAYVLPQVHQGQSGPRAVRNAIAVINESELLGFDRELRFSTDPQSRLGIVQVLSRSTGQVIVQLPSEFVLNLAQNLQKGN